MRRSIYLRFLKRPIDLVVAVVALLALTPVWVTVAVAIAWTMGRPVLFRQARAGWHGVVFNVFKFRTMSEVRDEQGNLLSDTARLTPLGAFLRKYSLDEIPQLLNVLRGDMAIVGPRPLLAAYLPRYSANQSRRHNMRPGITGWAQIHGRNTLDWPARFELDVWYVEHVTFALDLWIILTTFTRIWRTEDTLPANQEAMPEFLGNMEEKSRSGRCTG